MNRYGVNATKFYDGTKVMPRVMQDIISSTVDIREDNNELSR